MQQESAPSSSPQAKRTGWDYLPAIFGWALAITLFFYFFSAARTVLLGFLAAAAVASALRPLRDHVPGPSWISGPLVWFGFLAILGSALTLLIWQVSGPAGEELRQWRVIVRNLDDLLARWSEALGLEKPVTIRSLIQQLDRFISGVPGGEIEVVSATAGFITSAGIALAFILFGSVFLLAETSRTLVRPLLGMLPERRRAQLVGSLEASEPRLRWWVIGTFISMVLVAGLTWVGFSIVGIELALPLALLAGFGEIVPIFGPVAAFLVALLFALTMSTTHVIGVIIVYLITQSLESYVVVPLVMKQAVKVPPVVTLFTIVLWTKAFGLGGLFLAIPINLVLWSVAENFLMAKEEGPKVRVESEWSEEGA
jgi:predicted PurR-regulated permease PerM